MTPARLRPRVMGIVNVTPDSFSGDGASAPAAAAHALRLITEGADLIDVGGESTRPGAAPVDEAAELARTLPTIAAVRAASDIPISIDTRKPAVARAAVAAGASVWNDVSALCGDPASLQTAAELGCPVVLMHMQGEPATMQVEPRYDDVVAEVAEFLLARADAAMVAGVRHDDIWLDPGIGFGKTLEHNLALLRALDRFVILGFPVVVGASRKGFIRAIDETARDPVDRLGGSLTVALAAARASVAVLRVHDVRPTIQALAVAAALDG